MFDERDSDELYKVNDKICSYGGLPKGLTSNQIKEMEVKDWKFVLDQLLSLQ